MRSVVRGTSCIGSVGQGVGRGGKMDKTVAVGGTDMAKSPLRRGRASISHPGARLGMSRRRMQVFYAGRVQGVGFRYQARQVASGFEVTGIVRNLPDGRVELVAEGTTDELKGFREAIRGSGLGPMIRDEQENWTEPSGEFRGFEIVR